jgi:hypothetical protein
VIYSALTPKMPFFVENVTILPGTDDTELLLRQFRGVPDFAELQKTIALD